LVDIDTLEVVCRMEVGETYWFIDKKGRFLGTVLETKGSRFLTENGNGFHRVEEFDLIMKIPKDQIVFCKSCRISDIQP